MPELEQYSIGDLRLTIGATSPVGQPTSYSLLLAEHIPDLRGKTVVDLGSGSGLLGIVAVKRGAPKVYVPDTHPAAIDFALNNAALNGVAHCFVQVLTGKEMLPLPAGERVDMVICNPAELPLPEPDRAYSPFYAGPDGRQMIEGVIRAARERLTPGGRLLMTHSSLADASKLLAPLIARLPKGARAAIPIRRLRWLTSASLCGFCAKPTYRRDNR
jgi:16S rRNA G1207 methylase RsmC